MPVGAAAVAAVAAPLMPVALRRDCVAAARRRWATPAAAAIGRARRARRATQVEERGQIQTQVQLRWRRATAAIHLCRAAPNEAADAAATVVAVAVVGRRDKLLPAFHRCPVADPARGKENRLEVEPLPLLQRRQGNGAALHRATRRATQARASRAAGQRVAPRLAPRAQGRERASVSASASGGMRWKWERRSEARRRIEAEESATRTILHRATAEERDPAAAAVVAVAATAEASCVAPVAVAIAVAARSRGTAGQAAVAGAAAGPAQARRRCRRSHRR